MKCPYCGRKMSEGQKFCEGCGAKFELEEKKEVPNIEPKNGKTGLIVGLIILVLVLIVGVIVGIVLLTGGSKENKDKENNTATNSNSSKDDDYKYIDYAKNIKYEEYLLDDEILIIIATNNNDKTMHIGANIYTYDEDGKKVYDVYSSAYPVGPGETAILSQNIDQRPFKTYKIEIEAEEDRVNNAHWKDLTIKDTDDGNGVILSVTNNADETVEDINIGVVFYKDGKPVALEMRFFTGNSIPLEVGQTKEEDFYPYDHDNNRIKYDSYKIYFNNAGTRKEKYKDR